MVTGQCLASIDAENLETLVCAWRFAGRRFSECNDGADCSAPGQNCSRSQNNGANPVLLGGSNRNARGLSSRNATYARGRCGSGTYRSLQLLLLLWLLLPFLGSILLSRRLRGSGSRGLR
jgi:hypothetical protein